MKDYKIWYRVDGGPQMEGAARAESKEKCERSLREGLERFFKVNITEVYIEEQNAEH